MAETVLPETQISIYFDKLSFPCISIFNNIFNNYIKYL